MEAPDVLNQERKPRMPLLKAYADVFRDWDSVLGAVIQNAALLPGVDPYKADLEALLAQARDLKIQQETMEGQRQGVTQKLKKVIKDGREAVRKLKAFATIHLGSDNMALSQFGIRVRVGRSFRKKSPGTPPTQSPGTPPPMVGTVQTPAHNPTESKPGKEEETHV
jgi:hypothetical protein